MQVWALYQQPLSMKCCQKPFHATKVRWRIVRISLDSHGRERRAGCPDYAATIPLVVDCGKHTIAIEFRHGTLSGVVSAISAPFSPYPSAAKMEIESVRYQIKPMNSSAYPCVPFGEG